MKFIDDVKPQSCAYWFYMFRYCTSFDLEKLEMSEAHSLAYTFHYCSAASSSVCCSFSKAASRASMRAMFSAAVPENS